MRAVEDGVDAPAERLNRVVHLVVNGIQGIHVEQPAPNARLVGCHDDLVAGLGELGNRFQASR